MTEDNILIVQNKQLHLNYLPTIENIEFVKAQKAYLKIIVFNRVLFSLLILGLLVFVGFIIELQKIPVIAYVVSFFVWIIFLSFNLWLTQKLYLNRGYAIRENDILFVQGWLFKSTYAVPINKIQHCIVKESWLEKRFALASLNLYTAAQGFNNISIRGLSNSEANSLKDILVNNHAHNVNSHEQLD